VGEQDSVKKRNVVAAVVGLIVAWGGPLVLLSPADRLLGAPGRISTMILEQLVLWGLVAVIAAIVIFWEKQPLASLSLQPFRWSSLAWGLLLAAVTIYIVMPSLTWALRVAGIPGFEAGMAKILILPVWIRLLAAVTAGIVEDTLFLGYAFNRLTLLTRSYWLSGVITVLVVSLLHFPHWGLGPVLAYFVAVGLGTAFFAWRRDLLANIVAHVTVDTMGLVIVPLLSQAR
jgi:membrane protease YdiL (CAAX protease family)